jgi:hypothetical protein
VPPSAKGFSIDTKEARVVDWGTRFGVSTNEKGQYMVQVIEGQVDVTEKSGTPTKQLTGGQKFDRGWLNSVLAAGKSASDEPNRWMPDALQDAGNGWRVISTAFGRGKDAYIQSSPQHEDHGRETLMRVKRSDHHAGLLRKSYIGFDLSALAGQRIQEAELVLTIEPSELGFASFVPDSTFTVHGLVDGQEDAWPETGLSWAEAPAHDPSSIHPIQASTRLLGSFQIAQGVNRGTCTVGGKAIADFLNQDTNGLVTLILVRETDENQSGGLVHAFATKENARRAPPLLRVR